MLNSKIIRPPNFTVIILKPSIHRWCSRLSAHCHQTRHGRGGYILNLKWNIEDEKKTWYALIVITLWWKRHIPSKRKINDKKKLSSQKKNTCNVANNNRYEDNKNSICQRWWEIVMRMNKQVYDCLCLCLRMGFCYMYFVGNRRRWNGATMILLSR